MYASLKRLSAAVLVGLCLHAPLYAQDMQAPTWSTTLEGEVKWLKQTSTGLLIAYSSKAMYGIDGDTHKIVWTNKWDMGLADIFTKSPLTADSFQEIDGSPYARIQEETGLIGQSQTTILDYTTGREIFSSKGKAIRINENYPLFGIGAMLLQYREEKNDYLALLDIATGQERWKIETVGPKRGLMRNAINSVNKQIGRNQNAVPIVDKEGNIFYAQGENLLRFDGKSGATLWKAKFDEKVGRLEFSEKGDVVYAGAGKYIMGYSVEKGEPVWKDPYKVPGAFKYFVPLSGNTLLVVTYNGITRIDEITGKSVWKKPNYVDLPLQTVEFLEKGMLVLSSSQKESQFDYIDYNGKDLWKRAYETDKPVTTYEITDKALLFANAEEANVIDWTDGRDDIWKKRIKLRGTPVVMVDRPRNTMLIYSNDKLYTISLADLSNKLLAEDIKFKGDDEDVQMIETRANGYLLSSNQNAWLIGFDGKVAFNKFYREVGAGKRALAILGSVAATAAEVAGTMNAGLNATKGFANGMTGRSGESNANFRAANNDVNVVIGSREANALFAGMLADRNKATFGTKDALFIMTGVEVNGTKRTGLIKLNKDTGAEMSQILLKDQTPIYVTDQATNSLYVIVDNNKFYTYKL